MERELLEVMEAVERELFGGDGWGCWGAGAVHEFQSGPEIQLKMSSRS